MGKMLLIVLELVWECSYFWHTQVFKKITWFYLKKNFAVTHNLFRKQSWRKTALLWRYSGQQSTVIVQHLIFERNWWIVRPRDNSTRPADTSPFFFFYHFYTFLFTRWCHRPTRPLSKFPAVMFFFKEVASLVTWV